jgi:isoprenylcysteine carboxyl methyltransferase (ICMT) family protein YpbQ
MFTLHPTFHGWMSWIGFLLILASLIAQYWIVSKDYNPHDRNIIFRSLSMSTLTLIIYSMFK